MPAIWERTSQKFMTKQKYSDGALWRVKIMFECFWSKVLQSIHIIIKEKMVLKSPFLSLWKVISWCAQQKLYAEENFFLNNSKNWVHSNCY